MIRNPGRAGVLLALTPVSFGAIADDNRADSVAGASAVSRVEIVGSRESDYVRGRSSSATKGDAALIDTPMAVISVPSAVIDDQKPLSILEIVQNVSGVQTQQGSFYDQYQIRGFGSGYGVTYRNGLQLEGVADSVNTAFIDRVEVVKGPASMLYGRVEPGGFVNVVTRKPERQRHVSLEQRFGSWSNWRSTLDATGAVTDSGDLSYRLIADIDKGDNFIDYDHHDKKAAYLALAYQRNGPVSAILTLEYYDYKTAGRGPNTNVPFGADGLPNPTGISRTRSTGDPTLWANFPDTVKRTLVGADWSYAFNDNWKLTNRFHVVAVDEVQSGLGDAGGVWAFVYNPLKRDIYNVNLDLSGHLAFAGVEHQILVGADTYKYKDDWRGYVWATELPYVTRYDAGYVDITPQLRALVAQSRDNVLWRTLESGSGVYFQDMIGVGAWRFLVGGRWDRAYQRYTNVYGSIDAPCYPNCDGQELGNWPADTAFSPRAAALYRLTPEVSLYGSYAKSFGSNNSSWLASGSQVPPEIGKQFELGAKWAAPNDRLMASATLFSLRKSNVLGPDPTDPSGMRQMAIGEVWSRGLELDVLGKLTDHLSTVASYTFDSVTITRDTNVPGNEGHRRLGTPRNAASLWAKYDFSPRSKSGWTAGAGIAIEGERMADDANTRRMPSYVKVDAMVGYRTLVAGHAVEAQLNVKNVFDRQYFDQIGWGTASFGAPRSVIGSVNIDF